MADFSQPSSQTCKMDGSEKATGKGRMVIGGIGIMVMKMGRMMVGLLC
jgi:hypothetical protein